jgi:hypothetical protein
MQMTAQDDCLMVAALAQFSYEFEDVDQEVADRAWELACGFANRQDLHPTDAFSQIDWSNSR